MSIWIPKDCSKNLKKFANIESPDIKIVEHSDNTISFTLLIDLNTMESALLKYSERR